MPMATIPSEDQAGQPSAQVCVHDPALIVVYFFNGVETDSSAIKERLSAVFDTLAAELDVREPFRPAVSRADLRSIRFTRYQWNSESLATLVQFRLAPSQVWCIQLALPVRTGPTLLEEALTAWRDLVDTGRDDEPMDKDRLYWGNSRLYWALSDEIAGTSGDSLALARAVQSRVGPSASDHRSTLRAGSSASDHRSTLRAGPSEPVQSAGQGAVTGPSPVRCQAVEPQGHVGDHGTLWRLDEPVAKAGPYQAAWLLLSSHAQNDAVSLGYILNGRFAVGEAYLCKAHYQARDYARVAHDLKNDINSVQGEITKLLALEGPSGFEPDRIGQARESLRSHGERIDRVAVAYSRLLFALSIIDRLHLTVKTNLDNFEQMAAEFNLWEHPASRSEIARLQGVLRQIEHDQRSRRASLQGFQTAIETVRARLDLIDDGLSAARLEIEQDEAKRSKRWDIVVAILGLVLGASQVVVLRGLEIIYMLLLLIGVVLALVVVLAWRWLRRSGKRRK